jgi:type IV secretory pathway VirB3-like protein
VAEEYEETPLYGADTRPATLRWIGLPLTVGTPLIMAVPILMNLFHTWRDRVVVYSILAIVALGLWSVLRYDHNALRILARWFQTKFKSFDAMKWKGATPDPFPFCASKIPHGIYEDIP